MLWGEVDRRISKGEEIDLTLQIRVEDEPSASQMWGEGEESYYRQDLAGQDPEKP